MFEGIKRSVRWIQATARIPLDNIALLQSDLLAMEQLKPLHVTYLPWTPSALRPSAIAVILNDIIINQRRSVVEFGAGISTIFIARTLSNCPGHLFSVEHDSEWLSIVRLALEREGLSDKVTLIHAPLVDSQWLVDSQCNIGSVSKGERGSSNVGVQNAKCDWYDRRVLDENLPDSGIDLVIVDGPPAHRRRMRFARYPALPYVMPRLSSQRTLILDDAHRPGEHAIIEDWQARFNVKFSVLKTRGNIAISHNDSMYAI